MKEQTVTEEYILTTKNLVLIRYLVEERILLCAILRPLYSAYPKQFQYTLPSNTNARVLESPTKFAFYGIIWNKVAHSVSG